MLKQPTGKKRKVTDEELRADLAAGMTQAEIAHKYGVTPAAISLRAKALDARTVSVVVAPGESKRFAAKTIDAIEGLTYSLDKVRRLMDACDEWLRDAEDPEKYDVTPRSDEVMVTHIVTERVNGREVKRKEKAKLSELLCRLEDGGWFVDNAETKFADPRELILKTAQETRATIQAAADLADKIYNARAVEAFRQAMLSEISKVDPQIAQRIAEAVQRSIVVCNAAGGFSELSPDGRQGRENSGF